MPLRRTPFYSVCQFSLGFIIGPMFLAYFMGRFSVFGTASIAGCFLFFFFLILILIYCIFYINYFILMRSLHYNHKEKKNII